ncbi:hypothetical protein ACN38_g7158 [Penicillium nordicum]|uniref:Uncharacterized protein n=1 Tax=Penicillium nordicum TaxID=229535 RepID=A0A0M8P7G7_9EURO|nr:hypothetical protein ACN38_g7158 [Penicillium nordicum]
MSLYSLFQQSAKPTLYHTLRRPQRRPLLTGYEPLDALFTILIIILHRPSIDTIVTITGQATPTNTYKPCHRHQNIQTRIGFSALI